jgi:hypothetical protein
MSSTNSNCPTEYPAGSTLLTTINQLTKGDIISPSTQTTTTPLAPIVTANYNNGDTSITVQVTVYIDSLDLVTSLQVYANPVLEDSSHKQLLYFVYNFKEEIPLAVYPYSFSFQIPSSPHGHTIKSLETFLWNLDPVTSRGTVTEVT